MSALIIVFAAAAAASTGIDPAWIAVIGAVFGGAGLKVTEAWLGRSKVKIDDATQIRDELRKEIADQREEIRVLEAEVLRWREEYYTLRDEHLKLQLDLLRKINDIKHEDETPSDPPLTDPPKE